MRWRCANVISFTIFESFKLYDKWMKSDFRLSWHRLNYYVYMQICSKSAQTQASVDSQFCNEHSRLFCLKLLCFIFLFLIFRSFSRHFCILMQHLWYSFACTVQNHRPISTIFFLLFSVLFANRFVSLSF